VDLGAVGPQGPQGPAGTPADDSVRYWNSAYGIIVFKRDNQIATTSGGALQVAASTQVGVNYAESFTAVEGRQYRFTYYCRAWGVNGGAGVQARIQFYPYVDGVDRQVQMNDPWCAKPATEWDTARAEFIMNCVAGGTGPDLSPGVHTFQFVVKADATGTHWFWNNASHFTIEDMGPISAAIPVKPPATTTAWIPITFIWPSPHDVRYRKVNDEVQFRGALKWENPGVGNPCVIMAADYRPAIATQRFVTGLLSTDGLTPQGSLLDIAISSGGGISIYGLSATNGFVSFDSVRYSTTL
jgi:hypothetical protein